MNDDGPSSFEVSNRMPSNVTSGANIGGGQGGETHSMIHIGKQALLDFGNVAIDSAVKLGASFEDSWSWLKAGAGALGSSITDVAGRIGNYLGTAEAKGDTLELSNISLNEVSQHGLPVVAADIQLKHASFHGSDGGQRGE
jgi:hypothetical protein